MAISPISPVSSQQTFATDKQLVTDTSKEPVPCNPVHFCRQCNAEWNGVKSTITSSDRQIGAESINTSGCPEEVAPRRTFQERCTNRYHKHRRWHWVLLGAVTIVVAMVVALAVRFRPRHASVPPVSIPTGVRKNGTGLVALDRGDESTTVDFFYQHQSGDIRHGVFDDASKQQWAHGGLQDNVLSEDVPRPRQGTPLMAVSYKIGNETTWRVFYIDSSDLLQESVGSTTNDTFPSMWSTGTLRRGQFKAHPSPHTGLSVCTNMMWSPDAAGFKNGSLVLFYGDADGTNRMLTRDVQDTAWTHNHTFEGSSAASGIECTCRKDEIVDAWMINDEGHLVQASLNFNPESNNSCYQPGKWRNGTVYSGPIQSPTSVSAIKYTGRSSTYRSNSTFVHYVAENNVVSGTNVDTSDRSHAPRLTNDTWAIGISPIVSDSKIASIDLTTNVQNPDTQEVGEDSKIFLQLTSNDAQISVMSRNFYDQSSLFGPDGSASDIGN